MSSSSEDAFKHVINSIYAAINDGNIEDALQISQETWLLKAISKHERFGATFREKTGLQRQSDNKRRWNALNHYWLYHKKSIKKKIDNLFQQSQQSQQSPLSFNSDTMAFSFNSSTFNNMVIQNQSQPQDEIQQHPPHHQQQHHDEINDQYSNQDHDLDQLQNAQTTIPQRFTPQRFTPQRLPPHRSTPQRPIPHQMSTPQRNTTNINRNLTPLFDRHQHGPAFSSNMCTSSNKENDVYLRYIKNKAKIDMKVVDSLVILAGDTDRSLYDLSSAQMDHLIGAMRGNDGPHHQIEAMNKLNRFKSGRDRISSSGEILNEMSELDMKFIRQQQQHRHEVMVEERMNFERVKHEMAQKELEYNEQNSNDNATIQAIKYNMEVFQKKVSSIDAASESLERKVRNETASQHDVYMGD
mmetsp:Transcript_13322/g.16194  ORF Transcript_13322/g.16194 Transcript_13322/m.16194 type:complete len:412 (+) Transcript_13322:149-1384(+)